ncbi:MAG: LamG domain-containing protein, partial [Candidatus Paceibacterota bacterium]
NTAGVLGSALTFNGTDGYLDCGPNSLIDVPGSPLNLSDKFTFSFWALTSSTAHQTVISGDGATDFNGTYNIYITNESIVYEKNNVDPDGETATAVFTYGKWQNVVVTYDNPTMKFYINGKMSHSGSAGAPTAFRSFLIGKRGGGSGSYFNGSLDEIKVFAQTITASEAQRLYAEGVPRHTLARQ